VAAASKTALIALASAASWGGGDFSGGMGAKSAGGGVAGTVRFVLLAHAMSLSALLSILIVTHAGLPHGAPVLWAILGGVTGALGLVAFYIALGRGAMGASAAVSGLLAAAIPAVVSSVLEGAPGVLRVAGFVIAAIAIWLIAAGDSPESTGESSTTMALAIAAGVAFGVYFVALRMANSLGLVAPMAIARSSSLCLLGTGLLLCRVWSLRTPHGGSTQTDEPHGAWFAGWPWAVGVALMDTGGNMLFVAATRMGRLDVASVLASLYPAATILLAAWHLHERPTRRQVVGMVTALVAVVMVTV
jgi:drug/metabolite transporter (DMT)-like permease